MSRSVAAVFSLTLGFPVLAMFAITATGGIKPDWLIMFLIGAIITALVVAAIFEVKRLVDLDSHRDSKQPESVPGEVLAAPHMAEITSPPLAVTSAADTGAATCIPELPASAAENAPRAMPEPIEVAPVTEIAVAPKARSRSKSGQRKPTAALVLDSPSSIDAPVPAKGKRKSGQPKRVTSA
jgi:hypothetical protein